jgi:hypothetical protein
MTRSSRRIGRTKAIATDLAMMQTHFRNPRHKADVRLASVKNGCGKPPLNFAPRWIDIRGAREAV